MSETAQALESMTSAGEFEKLATAVLRRARPEYLGLIHTGRNPEGKTVRSPVDGVYLVPGSDPPHFVLVQHATVKRNALRKKWLSKKTPEGDVVKALHLAEEERRKNPETQVTLVLTCNRIPPEDLVRDVGRACSAGRIKHDIWDLSLLQDFLDINADGQWIRKEHLKIEQERLSVDLLHCLSERSCAEYTARGLFGSKEEEWVPRSLDSELWRAVFQGPSGSVAFLVADSGLGKSTATCRLLQEHLRQGGFGLWLEPNVVQSALAIEIAIEATLRALHPRIETGCGAGAIDLARKHGELLLIVDDVNKALAPAHLVQRVAGWHGHRAATGQGRDEAKGGYRIVCPAWPQVIGQIADPAEQAVRDLCFYAGPFLPTEGSAALQRNAELAGAEMTELEARELSERLGHDPLLISLWSEPPKKGPVAGDGVPVSAKVIGKFLWKRLEKLGLAEEYEEALLALARRMLEERTMEPTWQQALVWFRGSSEEENLRRLLDQREIIRLDGPAPTRKLAFRHDRIRDHLLAQAFHGWMAREEVLASLLEDPYYAEILGQALLLGDLDVVWASRSAASNPLALFYAFRTFHQPTTPMEQAILQAIRQWVRDEIIPDRCVRPLRWAIDRVLAETDSPLMIDLTESFPFPSYALWEARMRNGDVEAAAEYCYRMTTRPSSWRDLLIEHATARFGRAFVQDLSAFLAREDLPEHLRIGALYLAGLLGASELAPAISLCWAHGSLSIPLLTAFLWAGMRCGTDPASLLDPMLGSWSTLPDERSEEHLPSDRSAVTAYGLTDAIARVGLEDAVVAYLLVHAQIKDGPLAWPLFVILRDLDNPDALEFCLRHEWGWDLGAQWHLFNRKRVVKSRGRLRRIWENEADDNKARLRAFELWTNNVGEEEAGELQAIGPTSLLYEQALRRRAEWGDRSCRAEMATKIKTAEHPFIWWFHCAKLWSEPIREALQGHFEQRSRQMTRGWNWKETNEDWETSRILSQISPSEAEEFIEKHWSHLRFSPRFIQAALYVGTPRTRALAAEAIQECPDPKRLFKYSDFGEVKHPDSERAGLSPEHLESFAPYLHLLDEHGLDHLWRACNRQGFFSWRRDHVDPLLPPEPSKRLGLTDEDLFAQLDDFAVHGKSRGFVYLWLEDFQQRGDPEDRAMDVVEAWLREHGSFEALEVAAECVALGGTRSDLGRLESSGLSANDPQVAKLLEATRFRVFRRSLN